MIQENIRNAVKTLFETGKKKKHIARLLNLNIKTVRAILKSEDVKSIHKERSDKIEIAEELLRELYADCQGYVERMQEKLKEEHNIQIGYSTLTRLVRSSGLGEPLFQRYQKYADLPGDEMQHDTSLYYLKIGGKKMKVIASGLYFRYSKIRYVKFYPKFNRFTMKCFFYCALRFYGYCARICIIDNTNLAVLHGSGENATFNEEMFSFSKQFGFQWKAHRIKEPNRKAGKERNFFTLETNFFPGREFSSLDDLNKQAFQWATERFARRPQSKSRLIPLQLFELEKPYLIKVPDFIMPPYTEHQRIIDRGGYVLFEGNFFWVPENEEIMHKRKQEVKIIAYEKTIDIYFKGKKLISYELPAWDVKNKNIYPPDLKKTPSQPSNRRKGSCREEEKLTAISPIVSEYLAFIKSLNCDIRQKPRLIRDLYRLSKKLHHPLFVATIERALKYRIDNFASLEKIAEQLLLYSGEGENKRKEEIILPADDYQKRESYKQGEFSFETDLKNYTKLIEEGEKNG